MTLETNDERETAMTCPKCNTELTTLIRALCPMEQRDEVRVIGGDAEDGLRVEFTGEIEIRQGEDTQAWLECPACGQELDEPTADCLGFVDTPTPKCETIRLEGGGEARGRNGSFTPSEMGVQRSETDGIIRLSVQSSRRYTDLPPICFSLSLSDAESLRRALGRQIATIGRSAT